MAGDDKRFPLRDFLGFDIERGDGRATARLVVGPHHLNPNGMVHGAVPFALMDTAMGAAVLSLAPEGGHCATIEMHTRFHAAATEGVLVAEVSVTSAGRRIVHLSGRTTDGDGRLLASATASFAMVAPRAGR